MSVQASPQFLSAQANPPQPVPRRATLVMQSSGFAPAVRSGGVCDSWSRLYQAGDLLVDLMLRPDASGALLQGQLLADGAEVGGSARLTLSRDGHPADHCRADAQGGFDLRLERSGRYGLQIEFGGALLALPDIEVH